MLHGLQVTTDFAALVHRIHLFVMNHQGFSQTIHTIPPLPPPYLRASRHHRPGNTWLPRVVATLQPREVPWWAKRPSCEIAQWSGCSTDKGKFEESVVEALMLCLKASDYEYWLREISCFKLMLVDKFVQSSQRLRGSIILTSPISWCQLTNNWPPAVSTRIVFLCSSREASETVWEFSHGDSVWLNRWPMHSLFWTVPSCLQLLPIVQPECIDLLTAGHVVLSRLLRYKWLG
jgi:hypothetical protein